MPEPSPRPPPRLVVSRPIEVIDSKDRSRRSKAKEHGRTSPSEWTDVEDSPPRRRRSSKRVSHRREKALGSSIGGRVSTSSLGRFIPNLGGIKELAESTAGSRPSTRGSDQARHGERSSTRRAHHREYAPSRPMKHRTGGVQRRAEKGFKVNPSLLSVVSGSTGVSDRSSGSGSTITQESYNKDQKDEPKKMETSPRAKSPNVFDYMDDRSTTDIDDSRSVASSAPSSHYPQSDAGSSVAPETPSSQSTFPSPTASRRLSGSEIRAKYDKDYAASICSGRSNSRSPDPSTLSVRHRPSIEDIPEHDEESNAPSIIETREQRRRSSSRSSARSSHRGSDHRLHHQEEAMRQHMAYLHQQQGHYSAPMYEHHRSHSASPMQSAPSPQQHHMAMQHYQWPQQHPPAAMSQTTPPPPPEATNGHVATQQRPEAPAPPDPTQRTLTGYELMALELSHPTSGFQPLYRKFEYLNHRILLHLQDEISELEDQLRHFDELIAQMIPDSPNGKPPSSRRGEAWGGHELHYRRTELLGRIFVKTEQYNRAMASYASMAKDAAPAEDSVIAAYREWVEKHKPIHEVETRFLQRGDDLVMPRAPGPVDSRNGRNVALMAWLPITLMLPLLLFSIIPTLGGRLLVTVLIAVGAFLVAATTRVRALMEAREWAVCGAVYGLLMAGVAGCVPCYGGK